MLNTTPMHSYTHIVPFPRENYAGHVYKLQNTCHFLHSTASVLLRHEKHTWRQLLFIKRMSLSFFFQDWDVYFAPLTKNSEQRPAQGCAWNHTLSSNHYPNHMVLLALSGDFPPPVPHVPKEGVHVKLIFPVQKCWFPPFSEHRSWWCGSLFSLSYEKLSKSGEKITMRFFPSLMTARWAFAASLCNDKMICIEFVIRSF